MSDEPTIQDCADRFDPINRAGVVRGCDRPGGKCEFCEADGKTGYAGMVLCAGCLANVKQFFGAVARGEFKDLREIIGKVRRSWE